MTERLSVADLRALRAAAQKQDRPSKYRNKPVVADGIRFASKKEREHYLLLKDREGKGEISGLALQRRFALLDPKAAGGRCEYVADFCFIDHSQDGRFRVIDTKGFETDAFKIKKKMMRALLGIEVEVV